jgi:hypothetical protein
MKKQKFSLILIVAYIIGLSISAFAEMGSENYTIPSSVVSGGGGSMGSTSYDTSSTLGQPSPLMNPANPPWSTNYDLYPGFWYTLDAALTACGGLSDFAAAFGSVSGDSSYSLECDLDGDGDVDGSDLAGF